ncbi:MAG: type 1 glutamine amidotransferase domain-containing protein [Acidimicrobiales bacterium]
MSDVLIPLPDTDFDVTEVAVPWKTLTQLGHTVTFATEHGDTAAADQLLLDGVVFGKLGAEAEPMSFYAEMIESEAFKSPTAWQDLDMEDFDGLILPGGHAPGMKQYLESKLLRGKILEFWHLRRPLGAICHGVIPLARTYDPDIDASILHDLHTTCLPKYMEKTAFYLTFWRRWRYYRTSKRYVENEVRGQLRNGVTQFHRGPRELSVRGTADDHTHAYVIEDGRYLSARWPGDAYLFAERFAEMLAVESW